MLMRLSLAAALIIAAPAFAQSPDVAPERSRRAPTIAAVLNACQADLKTLCGEEPFEASGLSQCVQRNREKVSQDCQAVFPAAVPEPSGPARTTDLRSAQRAMRQACAADLRSICGGKVGRERGACLRENREKFSPACLTALSDLRSARQAQRPGRNRQDQGEEDEF